MDTSPDHITPCSRMSVWGKKRRGKGKQLHMCLLLKKGEHTQRKKEIFQFYGSQGGGGGGGGGTHVPEMPLSSLNPPGRNCFLNGHTKLGSFFNLHFFVVKVS